MDGLNDGGLTRERGRRASVQIRRPGENVTQHRPTILQIIPELDTGGAELATVEIADAVTKAGGRALVLSEGGRLAERLAAAGGELIPFPAATKNPARILWNARRIRELAAAEGVDLIHARSRAPAWSALIAARKAHLPFVTTYHGAYGEKGRIKNWYNGVMARADVVIANSDYTAGLIRARYATPNERLVVIQRGVDGARFDPAAIASERVAALRRSWGVEPGQRVILHAARITGWKGQSTVIAAAAILAGRAVGSEAVPDWVVVFAGDDQGRAEYKSRLVEQARAAGIADRIRFAGHVDDMPAAFRAAHVAVVASTEPEAFGRAATEAQVMACPVIATRLGAPQETVLATPAVAAGQRTGWLVPPGDGAALADALAETMALPAPDREVLGARARAHVLDRFSLAQMKSQTLAVYDRLLGTRLAGDA